MFLINLAFARDRSIEKRIKMSPKLRDKIAIITGGGRGIGLAAAKRFVDEGAFVFITGRRPEELDKAKIDIGHDVTTVQGRYRRP